MSGYEFLFDETYVPWTVLPTLPVRPITPNYDEISHFSDVQLAAGEYILGSSTSWGSSFFSITNQFVNNGLVWVESTQPSVLVRALSYDNVVNRGDIIVLGREVTGAFDLWTGNGFQNDGSIFVVAATGRAYGVSLGTINNSFVSFEPHERMNNGLIHVWSGTGDAIAVDAGEGRDFLNAGDLIADGFAGAIALSVGSEGRNEGAITARSEGGDAIGALLDFSRSPAIFENAGVIDAAIGIAVGTAGRRGLSIGTVINEATGVIRGSIEVYGERSLNLTNLGVIEGNITGRYGSDIVNLSSGQFVGVITLGHGNDIVYGGTQGFTAFGGADNDFLSGGDGDDQLDGGEGRDLISGGAGTNVLTGGDGADTFIVRVESGTQIITDFDPSEDTLSIRLGPNVTVSTVLTTARQSGGDAVLTLPSGGTITLQNTRISDLNSENMKTPESEPGPNIETVFIRSPGPLPLFDLAPLLSDIDGNFRVSEGGAIVTSDQRVGVEIRGAGVFDTTPTITIDGQVWLTGGGFAAIEALSGVGDLINNGEIVRYVSENTSGITSSNATALFLSWSGALENNGLIASINGNYDEVSRAVNMTGGPLEILSVNTGEILAEGGNAISLRVGNSLNLNNSGDIIAAGFTSAFAIGVAAKAYILNSGTIQAVFHSEGVGRETASIAISSHLGGEVYNSGLIDADIAVTFDPNGQLNSRTNLVDNSGSIFGHLIMGRANSHDIVLNSGVIEGELYMGGGRDYVGGSSGTIRGTIYAGDGADRIVSGRGDDIVFGELGGDELSGGSGNDLLVGGQGRDVLDGGTGSDTLDGGWDNDRLFVEGGDDARGGAGDDSIIVKDSLFQRIDGGSGWCLTSALMAQI